MSPYMNTAPLQIVDEQDYQQGTRWVVKTKAPVDDGVEFSFEVCDYGTDDYTTGGIVDVGDRYYMREVAMWFRSNRGHIRYSFEVFMDQDH